MKHIFHFLITCDEFIRRVTSLSNIEFTIKVIKLLIQFLVGVYVFMTFSKFFSDFYLIWLVVNILFAFKPITTKHKDKVQHLVGIGQQYWTRAILYLDSLIHKYKEPSKTN